jgi:hypothetical protein
MNLWESVCLARGQCRLLNRKCFLLIAIDCMNLQGHTLKEGGLKVQMDQLDWVHDAVVLATLIVLCKWKIVGYMPKSQCGLSSPCGPISKPIYANQRPWGWLTIITKGTRQHMLWTTCGIWSKTKSITAETHYLTWKTPPMRRGKTTGTSQQQSHYLKSFGLHA